jgi:hypothetical protein
VAQVADALGDPSLALAYWLPAERRWVADGAALELPQAQFRMARDRAPEGSDTRLLLDVPERGHAE